MKRLTRREFLTTTAAAVAVPTIIPSSAFGANERVVTGHIGIGRQGKYNLAAFLKLAPVAAICDVDRAHLDDGVRQVQEAGKTCDAYGDYRRLLDRKDIDAVVVSTPDHWHALPTIHACQAGKDVYVEKPLTHNVAEGRAMVDAARKSQRIVQTGSQQRSDNRFRLACELVRSGKIGKVTTVLAGLPKSNFTGPPVPDSDPPRELDYDFWLGPAPSRPYNVNRVHYQFRFFWDYAGGMMTNWGAHHIDIAQWGLGRDGSGPVSTEGTATFHPEHWFEVPVTSRVTHTYADGVVLLTGQLQEDIPEYVTFIGTEGKIWVSRSEITSTPAEILRTALS